MNGSFLLHHNGNISSRWKKLSARFYLVLRSTHEENGVSFGPGQTFGQDF
ncbi:Hypothetical protein FKW44_008452 [Caligus rogercresseyi]|uniref:Uncharacterized protein n=1 Tax=Caligus rogercresseyi TaxID=217165 RepID=A0A7T8QU98_CALRO|nr:Hypothetical protein FKW44_008452 [Caligus rogercresseyi]